MAANESKLCSVFFVDEDVVTVHHCIIQFERSSLMQPPCYHVPPTIYRSDDHKATFTALLEEEARLRPKGKPTHDQITALQDIAQVWIHGEWLHARLYVDRLHAHRNVGWSHGT